MYTSGLYMYISRIADAISAGGVIAREIYIHTYTIHLYYIYDNNIKCTYDNHRQSNNVHSIVAFRHFVGMNSAQPES